MRDATKNVFSSRFSIAIKATIGLGAKDTSDRGGKEKSSKQMEWLQKVYGTQANMLNSERAGGAEITLRS